MWGSASFAISARTSNMELEQVARLTRVWRELAGFHGLSEGLVAMHNLHERYEICCIERLSLAALFP